MVFRKKKFKNLLENNRWLKKVPNFLTICNSLCGFAAILYTLHVYDSPKMPEKVLAVSAWIILFAMFFDALDGFAARIFNAASMHGLQMDSLSDMVTFGVAPAIIVAVMAHSMRDMKSYQYFIVWAFCGVYLGCAALRLATYNVHAILEKKSGDKFSGLPTPGAASAICSLVILYATSKEEIKQIVTILPIYAAILGTLMVSNVQYIHAGRWILSIRRNKKRLFVLFIALGSMYYFDPILIIAIIINAYVLSGPFIAIAKKFGAIPIDSTELEKQHNKG